MIHIHCSNGQQFDLVEHTLVPVVGGMKESQFIKEGDMIPTSDREPTYDFVGDTKPIYLLVVFVRKS